MTTVKSFNGWIMSKLLSYLTTSEGMTTEISHYTYDGVRTIVQDAFGYRYEIQVKTLGRIQTPNEDTEYDPVQDLCNF